MVTVFARKFDQTANVALPAEFKKTRWAEASIRWSHHWQFMRFVETYTSSVVIVRIEDGRSMFPATVGFRSRMQSHERERGWRKRAQVDLSAANPAMIGVYSRKSAIKSYGKARCALLHPHFAILGGLTKRIL